MFRYNTRGKLPTTPIITLASTKNKNHSFPVPAFYSEHSLLSENKMVYYRRPDVVASHGLERHPSISIGELRDK